jgi:Protein of unknown function (DUF2845)
MKTIAISLWAAAASFCASVQAEALRCNGDLAQIRDSKASVLQKCGAPFFSESFCKPAYQSVPLPADPDISTGIVLTCVPVDEWSYNPGSGQFITTLRFEGGVMTAIRFGDRVY